MRGDLDKFNSPFFLAIVLTVLSSRVTLKFGIICWEKGYEQKKKGLNNKFSKSNDNSTL